MKKDTLRIILAFLATVVVVYGLPRLGLPNVIIQGIFLLLIVYVYNSRDDVFWLAWYFAVANAPGRLFGSATYASYSLPIYNPMPGVATSFTELFLIMYIAKILRYKTANPFIFKRQIWLYIGIGILYFAISFALGISFSNIINTVRMLLPWFWIFIISRYIKNEKELQRFFLMILPFTLLALAATLQTYITGSYLGDILGAKSYVRVFEASEEHALRVYSSASLNIITLILGVYYLARERTKLDPNLLMLVTVASAMNIFLSATRGWMIFMLILFSSFFFMRGFGMFTQFIRMIVILSLMFVVLTFVYPSITNQFLLSLERFLTLEFLAEGDLSAQGTISRLTTRGPRVMSAWRESPIIGWGFSNKFHAYADGHVGNQTNLLNLGIIGFIAIHLIYLTIFFKTYSLGRRHEIKRIKGNASIVFLFAMFGLFIAHSSSSALWGLYTGNGFFWGIIFAAINAEFNPAISGPASSKGLAGEIA